MRPLRICIIGLDDYGMLTGETTTAYVGGETVQHVLLARAWRDLGADVSIIVLDHGQGRVTNVDGIRAIAAYERSAGLPGVRFFFPRMTGLLAAMREADADVYYQSLASANTGITAWFCRRHGRRFVFRISSDAYCIPGEQLIRFWRDRKIYEYGLKRADVIAAQTTYQQQLLKQHYGLDSQVVNMVVELPQTTAAPKDIDVLWVSNLRPVKRPELVIDLARRLPNVRFVVVGGGRDVNTRPMREAASQLANLEYAGPIAYSRVGEYFDRARIFLNTSSLEGFPNTFLQAWVRSLPVVSFFDPDRLIERHGLGRKCTDLDEMVRSLTELLGREDERSAIGQRARAFALNEYSARNVAGRYLDLLAPANASDLASSGSAVAVRR